MRGFELYDMYREALLEAGVATDNWVDLDESDRAAWNAVAAQVEIK